MGWEWLEADDMKKTARLTALASASGSFTHGEVFCSVLITNWTSSESGSIIADNDQSLEHMQVIISQ